MRKPIIKLRHQHFVAQFFAPGKHCANTERRGTLGPGKKVQPSCPHTLQQRSRNCFRVGAVVGSTGKTNGADSPFTQCLHSAGIRPETDSAHILDPIREQRLHCGRVYWSGREYRSEEHTSELQSLMRTSYAVFCLKK